MGYINQRGSTGVNPRSSSIKVFINDIFYFVQESTIDNYADDNALSYSDTIRLRIFNCWDAFLQISDICLSQFRWESTVMPKGLTFSSHNIYYSFILSNFNYCPVTWHFCSEKILKKIKKIQERALRFIYEDYENTYDNWIILLKCSNDISCLKWFGSSFQNCAALYRK
jgi:hypothetical protein